MIGDYSDYGKDITRHQCCSVLHIITTVVMSVVFDYDMLMLTGGQPFLFMVTSLRVKEIGP